MNAPVAAASSASTSLDELIYVELIGRAFLRIENNAVIKPEPAVLAKLSIDLADAYRAEHKARLAELGPKNVGYEIQMDDIANWDKKI